MDRKFDSNNDFSKDTLRDEKTRDQEKVKSQNISIPIGPPNVPAAILYFAKSTLSRHSMSYNSMLLEGWKINSKVKPII